MNLRRALAVAVLGCTVVFSSARAGDPTPFRLEEYVGADTLAFVSIEGFPTGWRAALGATPLGSLLRDEGFDSAIRPAFDLLRRALGRAGADAAICTRYATALEGLDGQLAIAVTGIRRDGTPDIVASFDFGARLSEFEAFTSRIVRLPPDLESWVSDVRTDGSGVVARFVSGDTVWEALTVGTTVVLDNLDRWSPSNGSIPKLERAADSLAKAPAFGAVLGSSKNASASCFAYANLARLVAHSLDAVDGTWSGAFVRASGLDALTTLSYRASVEGPAVVESLRVGASKGEKGVFSLFRTVPIADSPELPVPARTWCRLDTSLPISTWPSRWRAFVHDVDADDEKDVVAGIARLNHATAMDLEADVLSRLGDQQTLTIGLSDGGGAIPDVVLSIPIRGGADLADLANPVNVESTFERAVVGILSDVSERGDTRWSQRTIRVGSRAMHVVDARDIAANESSAFSPTWAIVDGRFVVTLVPHSMRALFRRIDRRNALGSIHIAQVPDASPDVAAALVSARASGTACRVGTRALLASAYDTLVPLAQAVPSWKDALLGVGLDVARLPDTDLVANAMSDTVLSLRIGSDGIEFDAHSSFGVVPLLLFVVGSVDAARSADDESSGFYSMAQSSNSGDAPAEVTRRALERTIQLLEEFHALRGSFPPSLDELVVAERLAPAVPLDGWRRRVGYQAPANGRPPRVTSAGPDGVFGTDDDVGMDVELAPK